MRNSEKLKPGLQAVKLTLKRLSHRWSNWSIVCCVHLSFFLYYFHSESLAMANVQCLRFSRISIEWLYSFVYLKFIVDKREKKDSIDPILSRFTD